MTDKHEALIFADDRWTSSGDDLYEWAIDAEDWIRRLHAENTTLQQGYAAARLEIESLKAQLHAAKQINAAQFWLFTSSITGSTLRVSHGQAPAQAAPTTQPAPQQEAQEPVAWRLVPADATDDLLKVALAYKDYIDALPSDVAAALPAMPGIDGDWAAGVLDRAARAPADSQPAWASQAVIEYRYAGGTRWCPLGPAERMKPNFDGVYRLQGGVFPVDAPADSVLEDAARWQRIR